MRNWIFTLVLLALTCTAAGAQDQDTTIQGFRFRLAMNYSDFNYGSEFIRSYLPTEKYFLFETGGSGGLGFMLGMAYTRKMTERIALTAGTSFSNFSYQIDGRVRDRNPQYPFEPNEPVEVKGAARYNYLGIDLSAQFLLGTGKWNRLYLEPGISGLIYLSNSRKYDVHFRDSPVTEIIQESDESSNFRAILPALNLAIGYRIPLNQVVSLSPFFQYQHSLGGVVNDALNPQIINLGVDAHMWF
ncbi:MAG: hypothetical protein R2792_16435 [Saprospiraceae bacterium]